MINLYRAAPANGHNFSTALDGLGLPGLRLSVRHAAAPQRVRATHMLLQG